MEVFHLHIILKAQLGNSLSFINEHLPIVMANSLEFLTVTAILVAIFAFTDSKMKLSDAFLIFGLYIMTISSRRNLFLLIPLCAVPVVKMISDFVNRNMKIDYSILAVKRFLTILFIIGSVIVILFSVNNFISSSKEEYINTEVYPVKASKWIKDNLDLENIRLYNQYDFGSYLLWQGIPVFVDSRCDLYTKQFNKGVTVLDDFMDAYRGQITFMKLFNKYKITHAIVNKKSVENVYMAESEDCKNIYEDDNFVIYEYSVIK